MKRICAFLLAIACCLSLFGCKKQEKPEPTQEPSEVTTEATVQTEAPTEAPTEAVTKKPTQKPTKETATAAANKRPTAATKASAAATTKTTTATKAPTKATVAAVTKETVTEPTQAHTHTFGEWVLQEASSCVAQGKETRRCDGCDFTETRTLPLEEHSLNATNMCRTCRQVIFDDKETLVELGVVCDSWYGAGVTANYAWDVKVWDGKVYRGAGDYDKNSGNTTILAYNIATHIWEKTGAAADEAIHSFEEIGGTLFAPGIDSRGSWDYGNYYVLQKDGKWKQIGNLPNGVHCFDMVECDGKIFAGLGTETTGRTVAVSEDGGKKFTFAPLYKDGALMDLSSFSGSRTYEFIKYKGQVYALIHFAMSFGGRYDVFRYEDGKMHYVANGYKLVGGTGVGRKHFTGEFEFNGSCYVTAGSLYAITDFADIDNYKKIEMPQKETVADALVEDGVIYVLATAANKNADNNSTESYKTVIYKSATGEAGSFEEVLCFDYPSRPCSFDYDGKHFYIGTGTSVDSTKVGMVLRATPEK